MDITHSSFSITVMTHDEHTVHTPALAFSVCVRRVSASVYVVLPILPPRTAIYASPWVGNYYSLHHDASEENKEDEDVCEAVLEGPKDIGDSDESNVDRITMEVYDPTSQYRRVGLRPKGHYVGWHVWRYREVSRCLREDGDQLCRKHLVKGKDMQLTTARNTGDNARNLKVDVLMRGAGPRRSSKSIGPGMRDLRQALLLRQVRQNMYHPRKTETLEEEFDENRKPTQSPEPPKMQELARERFRKTNWHYKGM
ncbi:hypothetical protein EDB85DRAFT_1944907 [Lactarius pseudohatsudake]|nr:hypothetical protein EDB85DRAFT_1944907 [Lactarius pseudohatsudake]